MNIGNKKISYSQNRPLDGAFKYIKNLTQTQEIVPNYVNVQVSSVYLQYLAKYPIVSSDTYTSYWASKDAQNSWYEVDLLKNSFYLESYTIRARNCDFITDWEVLGSNDGVHYDLVDVKHNQTMPETLSLPSMHFECEQPKTRRMFKFMPKGKNFDENYHFVLCNLELFGKFKPIFRYQRITKAIRQFYYLPCLIVIIIC